MYVCMYVIGLVITFAVHVVLAAECDWVCPPLDSPVCGSNDRTYNNICELYKAICRDNRLRLKHRGLCRATQPPNCEDRACIMLYDPVCGTDGRTYSNGCFLGLARCRNQSLRVAHRGPCRGNSGPLGLPSRR